MTKDTAQPVDNVVRKPEDFPPFEHLLFWWKCDRKWAYDSEADAIHANLPYAEASGTESYLCEYKCHWHNGHPSTALSGFSKGSVPSRLRRQWERQIKKPTPEELAKRYQETLWD